jgi:hypothetical protein
MTCTPQTNNTSDDHTAIPVSGTSLEALAKRVSAVEIDTPLETVLDTQGKLDFMLNAIRDLKSKLTEQLILWIEANGDITVGTRRLYVGTRRETKCRDLRPAIEALLNDCDGDIDKLCRCLSVNAIKAGAAKIVMTEQHYDQHFQVVEKTELREGVETPVKSLIEVDTAFTTPRKRT